jgi:hypothetical protein
VLALANFYSTGGLLRLRWVFYLLFWKSVTLIVRFLFGLSLSI